MKREKGTGYNNNNDVKAMTIVMYLDFEGC